MYPNNENDEKRVYSGDSDSPAEASAQTGIFNAEPIHDKPNYLEQTGSEPIHNAAPYGNQNYNDTVYTHMPYGEHASYEAHTPRGEHTYVMPIQSGNAYGESILSEPPLYNPSMPGEPVLSEPVLSEPPLNEQHVYNASVPIVYSETYDAQQSMYSPGICVSQPYPPPQRGNAAEKQSAQRSLAQQKRNNLLFAFLRAVCLVIVCSMFSGIAAYSVIDYRINRGDFNSGNQVIFGGVPDTRTDDRLTEPISSVDNSMSAQDIYDMARTQVVGIVTELPGMLGVQSPQSNVTPVTGSGFIISSDGYILTNYHVIEFAHVDKLPLNVVLNDGSSYPAEIIGFEANNDVAVVKIDAQGLSPVLIGNSNNIRVGQTIYAIGNPFGDLVNTMTDGIVSALDRVVSVEGTSINTFQFSAPVNRGNSGGPVFNTYGEVLGIVTAKVVRGNVEGIGFAIPINDAIEIATELIEHGYLSGRPLLGISGQDVSQGHAEYFGWVVGFLVNSVSPDSAAEAAGIESGDIIIALNGVEIDSVQGLRFALRDHRAGETTSITVWREGDIHELTITFDEDIYAGQP